MRIPGVHPLFTRKCPEIGPENRCYALAMKSLKHLSNPDLIANTRSLAVEERRITALVLDHLEEIEARRVHLDMGYPSLFEFCRRELGYSEDQAQYRIDAMRGSRGMPEVRKAVEEGRISMTNLVKAKRFFSHEKKSGKPYSPEAKHVLLAQLEGQSTRECERKLAELCPTLPPPEKTRPVAGQRTLISFTADERLMTDIEKIKRLWAHKNANFTFAELFTEITQTLLKKIDPENLPPVAPRINENSNTRHIPNKTRKFVWQRDEGKCTYLDPQSKRVCNSTHAIQIDHLDPYSMGGTHDPENLRLLCRAHNQHNADQLGLTRT
jgi:hypothetical protein